MNRRRTTLKEPGEALAFDERVVIVTGAGSGLGREYSLQLAGRGARVVANGRSEGNIAETVEKIHASGGQAIGCVVDVTEADAGEHVVASALDAWGRVDALVNNAGLGHSGSPDAFSWREFDAELQVSLHASVALSLAAWPHLGASGAGRIVNTSSSAIFGMPGSIPYASAKASVLGLTRALAIDGRAVGIRVNAVMPLALTPMNASLPYEDLVRQFRENFPVRDAAALVLLLAHERAPVSGETFVTGGGFSARVSLAVGSGVVQEESSPEDLLARFDEVMSLEDAPASVATPEVRGFIIDRLRGGVPRGGDA